ncbi:MAG: hypothetical protein NW215_01170 [Hyphomicrobiales bacterium]|nr:hypothetical protein [Hyphomicrobiales bacterium]
MKTSAALDAASARRVTEVFIRLARRHLSEPVLGDLLTALPGAAAVNGETAHAAPATDIERMMAGAMANALGLEDPILTLMADLKAAGLTSHQALVAGRTFLDFTRDKAGPTVAERVTAEIPGLRRLN